MDWEKYESLKQKYQNKELTMATVETEVEKLIAKVASPLKEFYQINIFLGKYYNVPKAKRAYLISNYAKIIASDLVNAKDKQKLRCALLDTYFYEHDYLQAESIAKEIEINDLADEYVIYQLMTYYIRTRRYDQAQKLGQIWPQSLILNENLVMIANIKAGKRMEYVPREGQEQYFNFLASINIMVNKSNYHKSLKRYQMPADFKTFVAFDLETTGLSYQNDEITEIAAIKVVNGQIEETKTFIFQELVCPLKKKIPENVENITGITNEMVKNARHIDQVLIDFLKFIDDNILVGYNCLRFDRLFLNTACKLVNCKINNPYFDVMEYVNNFYTELKFQNRTLAHISELLDIKNPRAHRALADAITTAKVYLKLQEMAEIKPGITN